MTEKIYHANTDEKISSIQSSYINIRLCALCSNKIAKNKEGYNIMMKESIHQKDLIISNVYTPKKKKTSKIHKVKTEKKNRSIVGDFNTSLSITNIISRWK